RRLRRVLAGELAVGHASLDLGGDVVRRERAPEERHQLLELGRLQDRDVLAPFEELEDLRRMHVPLDAFEDDLHRLEVALRNAADERVRLAPLEFAGRHPERERKQLTREELVRGRQIVLVREAQLEQRLLERTPLRLHVLKAALKIGLGDAAAAK